MDWSPISACDHQVAQAAEQAIEEKVELITVELLHRLEAKEEHDVLRDSLLVPVNTD